METRSLKTPKLKNKTKPKRPNHKPPAFLLSTFFLTIGQHTQAFPTPLPLNNNKEQENRRGTESSGACPLETPPVYLAQAGPRGEGQGKADWLEPVWPPGPCRLRGDNPVRMLSCLL